MYNEENDILSEEELETLGYRLHSQKELSTELAEKFEQKRWRNLEKPFTMENLLARLNEEDIKWIMRNIAPKCIKYNTKEKMIDYVSKLILTFLEITLAWLDNDQFSLIKKIVAANGILAVEDMPLEKSKYLERHGLFFPGTLDDQQVLVMGNQIVEHLKQIDFDRLEARTRQQYKLNLLIQGLLYHYGCIGIWVLHKMLARRYNLHYSHKDFQGYINILLFKHDHIHLESGYLYHNYVHDYRVVVQKQNARRDLEYKEFSPAELEKAGKPGFTMDNEALTTLKEYLDSSFYPIEDEGADDLEEENRSTIRSLDMYARQGKSPEEFLQYVQYFYNVPDSHKPFLLKVFTEIYNEASHWALKGHSPNDTGEALIREKPPLLEKARRQPGIIHGEPFTQKATSDNRSFSNTPSRKTGRNEPCPCGSGKKYKHCCLGKTAR